MAQQNKSLCLNSPNDGGQREADNSITFQVRFLFVVRQRHGLCDRLRRRVEIVYLGTGVCLGWLVERLAKRGHISRMVRQDKVKLSKVR